MRSIYHFFAALLFTAALSACSQDEELTPELDANLVQIEAQIENIAPETRAEIGIDGKGHFVDGDAISLYVNGVQSAHVLTGGNWQPSLSWDNISGDKAYFRAFFPQLNHNDWSFTHTVAANQDDDTNFENSDLLYADEVEVNRGDKVQLRFRHLMSCLTVILKSSDFTEEQLSQATVKVKAYNRVNIEENGTVGKIHDYDYDKSQMADITFNYKGNGTFQAVMAPQKRVTYWSYDEWWLSITINGKTLSVKEPPTLSNGTQLNAYESGKNITLTYHIRNKNFANKTFWVDGVQGIPDSSTDAWKKISHVSKLKHLPYHEGYGWFDCSKKNTESSEPYHDMNKCWAATASNLIHWWLARNDAYIQQYCKKKNVKSLSDLNVPHIYTNHHETEVFQAFRDKFTDEGSFTSDGMAWYFLGKYKNETGRSQLISPNTQSGGFFKEVLGENTPMSKNTYISDMTFLNKALKEGLLEKKGIAFSIFLPGFASAHAMTIWGAKFDAKGDVCAIYYVDNNDGTLGQEHIGLIEARVGEYEGTDPAMKGRACLENWEGKLLIQIQTIDLLDLREEAWKKYLGQ